MITISQNGTLLHMIYRREDITKERVDIAPEEEFLQVSCFAMDKGKTFKPHKHIEQIRTSDIAQESWCIVQGRVEAIYYNLDDEVMQRMVLNAGDISITFRGGHNYKCLEDNTLVYEYKTGPYQGQALDKEFIDEN